jgi:membrane associated rhomboid family serine protease
MIFVLCDDPLAYGVATLANQSMKQGVLPRFVPAIALTAVCWAVFLVNNVLLNGSLTGYGIVPRHISSLPGILWSPFLHASFQHLAANTVPLLILGLIICGRSKKEFSAACASGILIGGGLTWLFARTACHVGASGLVFCFFGYVASLAYFRRTFGSLLLSVACIVGYGGLLRGVLPTTVAISWEGHLSGLLAGIAAAWMVSNTRKTASLRKP